MRAIQYYIFKIFPKELNIMNAPLPPQKNILMKAYECKMRNKVNIQEFFDIVNASVVLNTISQKGLFVLYLCEILLKAYIASGLKIKNFISELEKKEAKKRKRREGDGRVGRKKRTNEGKRGDKTLEELSDESLSNPSNIERPRVNAEGRQEDSSNPALQSRERGDDSHGSKENTDKNNLKIQLNKITQQIRGHDQTYVTDVDFIPHAAFDDNSNSSSLSGQISNFSQKIKIFTNAKQSQPRTVTTRRKMGNRGLSRQAKTKKKNYEIIDQSTLIEEVRGQNDLTINHTEVSHFDTHQIVDFDLTNYFIKNLQKDDKEIGQLIFQKDKIEMLRSIIHDERQIQEMSYNMGGGMMPIDENQLAFPDYTMSQPTSAPVIELDFFKQSLQLKDSQFSFKELINHSKKDKATLFYQLLWRQQNDEITILQAHPQTFSQIRIKQK